MAAEPRGQGDVAAHRPERRRVSDGEHERRSADRPFALWPPGRFFVPELHAFVGFRPWQLVTYAFLHGGVAHLFLNMLALRIFGRDVEAVLGGARYLALYVAAVLSAALVQLAVVAAAGGAPYPTIGASGGVFGILLAFGVLFPRRIVTLLFPPVPMPAWLFVTLYGVVELSVPLWEGGTPHLQVTPSGGLRYGGWYGPVPARSAHRL